MNEYLRTLKTCISDLKILAESLDERKEYTKDTIDASIYYLNDLLEIKTRSDSN